MVADRIAAEISKRVDIFVISMGSGPHCDGHYLFACDILGTHQGHYPRHSKTYRNFHAEMQRLHQEAIAAMKEFKADVETGAYPEARHMVPIQDEEFEKFMDQVDSL